MYFDHMTDHLYVVERVGGVWQCATTTTALTCTLVAGGTRQASGIAVHKGYAFVADGAVGVRRIYISDALGRYFPLCVCVFFDAHARC